MNIHLVIYYIILIKKILINDINNKNQKINKNTMKLKYIIKKIQ